MSTAGAWNLVSEAGQPKKEGWYFVCYLARYSNAPWKFSYGWDKYCGSGTTAGWIRMPPFAWAVPSQPCRMPMNAAHRAALAEHEKAEKKRKAHEEVEKRFA